MRIRKTMMLTGALAGMGCMVLAFVFCACGLPFVVAKKATEPVIHGVQEAREHNQGPAPESEWNKEGLWYRVSNSPPTFFPKGYGRGRSRDGSAGTWVVDQRDGKKLFVPKGGADGLSEAVLLTEAKQATRWKTRPKLKLNMDSLMNGPEHPEF